MFLRSELKFQAKQSLKGNYGSAIAVTLLCGIVAGLLSFTIRYASGTGVGDLATLVDLLVAGPLQLASVVFFIALARNHQTDLNNFFQGFSQAGKAILAYLWQSIWILLWCLLLFIPGLVKAYSYSQYFYILADHPDADLRQALKTSMKMTSGYKMELFLLDLSFLGWFLLAICTLGLSLLHTIPYIRTTSVKAYDYLKQQALENGVCTPEEFGMVAPVPPVTDEDLFACIRNNEDNGFEAAPQTKPTVQLEKTTATATNDTGTDDDEALFACIRDDNGFEATAPSTKSITQPETPLKVEPSSPEQSAEEEALFACIRDEDTETQK